MFVATATLESVSPVSFSRYHNTAKLVKEGADEYEKRTWREKSHYDESGMLFIPAMAFKNSLAEAAAMLGMKIPGKGNATYTKHFVAGIQVFDPLPLTVHKEKVNGEWVHCNADGKKGSGKRVMRCFPVVQKWSGKLKFMVVDSTITQDIFLRHLKETGTLVGVCRWRPRNGGLNGRFMVKDLKWSEYGV